MSHTEENILIIAPALKRLSELFEDELTHFKSGGKLTVLKKFEAAKVRLIDEIAADQDIQGEQVAKKDHTLSPLKKVLNISTCGDSPPPCEAHKKNPENCSRPNGISILE